MRPARRSRGVVCLALGIGLLSSSAPALATNIGNEGCTPGYWRNHTDNWEEYAPTELLRWSFGDPVTKAFPAHLAELSDDTFLDALNYGGGPGQLGGARILLRASAAAYLNAAHEGLGYPYRRLADPGQLKKQIISALQGGDRDEMIALAEWLDEANNLGCPLN